MKIVLTGGCGLVGQNLLTLLPKHGYDQIVVIDKHDNNLKKAKELHREVTFIRGDLAEFTGWEKCLEGADALVILHAQIGGNSAAEFTRNNIEATKNVIAAAVTNGIVSCVHVSSSVVNSVATDMYSNSKRAQEKLIIDSKLECVILRPTLMFGFFDRKHFGWLARFMRRMPIFPIPGSGAYTRQPLYALDFCRIILQCLKSDRYNGATFDITGRERIHYLDIIRKIKSVTGARAKIVKIPFSLFYALLAVWGAADRNPPFTTQQLLALVAEDEFEVIDWPEIFGVAATPLSEALLESFSHPVYSGIELEF